MIIKRLLIEDINTEVEQEVLALFRQLSPIKENKTLERVFEQSPQTMCMVAIDKDSIIGIACLAIYEVISSKKAWIEDLVVDHKHRGKGIGKLLLKALINDANQEKCTDIMLYTEPEKEAANALYLKLGFNKRSSSLFQLKLK